MKCFIMIRVLLVPSSDYLGHPFPQRHNQIFERLHDGKNFEVHVARFTLFEEPRLKSKTIVHELEGRKTGHVASYSLVNMFSHVNQIRQIIRKEGIDVVVMSNLSAPFAYDMLDTISHLGTPTIFDLPDYYPTSATGYLFDVSKLPGRLITGTFDFMLRYMVRRSTVVTVASGALQRYARQVGAPNVLHIPNGIAECFLNLNNRSGLRQKFGYEEEDLVVGYIGTLEFWLDMRSLINGIALARGKGFPVKLLIIGGKLYTKYSNKVSDWIREKNLENHARLLDFVPYEEVPKFIVEFDVGTIPFAVSNPTAYYSAPNKMWEYFSQKKPVIATPIPEVLNNSDCVLTALTPEDYQRSFSMIAEKRREVDYKVNVGYNKALTRTWKHSAELFASTINSMLNARN